MAAVEAAYARDETDEFVKPTVIDGFGGIKDGDESVEVAVTRRQEKGVDDCPLTRDVPIWCTRIGAANSATRAARQLPGGCRRPADNGCDLLKGQVEHVVKHESQPFGRWQGIEDDLKS